MKFLITVDDGTGPRTYPAIGNIADLTDAAIDAGALGISYRVIA